MNRNLFLSITASAFGIKQPLIRRPINQMNNHIGKKQLTSSRCLGTYQEHREIVIRALRL